MHKKILELRAARPARASAASEASDLGIIVASAEGELKELPASRDL